ncbi:MAG: hypothetical protein IJF97_09760 [Eggerthellaceae bacterium]|nr:hypothetical protein [Eggerthellaceae bacterium]
MGLIIDEVLPNGVPLKYFRISSLTTVVNNNCIIEVVGYTSQEKREEEQQCDPEVGCDVYIDTRIIEVDYDPDMSVNKAYALLKAMPEWEDAEDVIDAWAAGLFYFVGDMVMYQEQQYECIQSHTAHEGYEPDTNPALWRPYSEGGDGIPVWSQPDSTNPYMRGDRVHYPDADGPVYESTIDNNVFSPEAYPQGWQLVEGGE